MIEIRGIKERARVSLERRLFGNLWVTLVVCLFAYGVLLGVPSAISSVVTRLSLAVGALIGFPLGLVSLAIAGPLAYGLARIFHKVALGNKRVDIVELFCGFREELGEAFLLGLLRTVFIFLWSLLLIVPGIIKSYAYSMAFFIQQEAKDKTWRHCLDESVALTDGYKGKLFLMDLSFIGWYLLGFLCLGVGALWVEVYHTEARAHFYEELKHVKGIKYTGESEESFFDAEKREEEAREDVFRVEDIDDENAQEEVFRIGDNRDE